MNGGWKMGSAWARRLTAGQTAAVFEVIRRVRASVPAVLYQASLFGSRARGEARRDSDVDILLVFQVLPPDREPHASMAEEIADLVAAESGVPVTVWSISLADLERGARTPMLVDALRDALPLWSPGTPIPPLRFTPEDAVRCTGALLDRVSEGGVMIPELMMDDPSVAARRVRDDLIRMCTAIRLLQGHTRRRRADLAIAVLRDDAAALGPLERRALRWAAAAFGEDGRDDDAIPPSENLRAMADAVGRLRALVVRRRSALIRHLARRNPAPDLHLSRWNHARPHTMYAASR